MGLDVYNDPNFETAFFQLLRDVEIWLPHDHRPARAGRLGETRRASR